VELEKQKEVLRLGDMTYTLQDVKLMTLNIDLQDIRRRQTTRHKVVDALDVYSVAL